MKHFLVFTLLFMTLFQCFYRFRQRFYPGTLKITFFDVGQGDSTLVQFPKGSTLLIDAGRGFRNWDIGHAILVRELGLRAILTLDTLLMTHPDQDHSFGLRGILSDLKVKEFWMNTDFLRHPNAVLQERLDLANSKGVRLMALEKEVGKVIDGANVRFIPLHVDSKTNNNCLVTLLQFGRCRVLLTGDIEEKAEEVLEKRIGRVDLLKIAHHGSKTSSSGHFLHSVRPRAGIISVGQKNRYGHPHPTVIRRLKNYGLEVFRTDFHGMTAFESDGKSWSCETTFGNCGLFQCEEDSE